MKSVLSVVAMVLLVGMFVPVSAEEAQPAAPVEQEAAAFSADQWLEDQAEANLQSLFPGGQCNQAVCGAGEFCCNFSCSTCTPLGGACTHQICPPVS